MAFTTYKPIVARPAPVSPRSIGYSYLPGATLASNTPTSPSGFGSGSSPTLPPGQVGLQGFLPPVKTSPITNTNTFEPSLGGYSPMQALPITPTHLTTGSPVLRQGTVLSTPSRPSPILTRVTAGLFS